MRAVVVHAFDAPDKTKVETVPVPALGTDEILVEVHAAPVNYVDLLVIGGTYQFKPELPFTPGKGPAGVVAAVAPGVTGFKVGDRVLAMAEIGGYAQYTAVSARNCYRLPDGMSFVQASTISLAYDTAWFALRERGRFQPGETVLVLGASGAVGFAAVEIAKALGGRVLAAVSRMEQGAALTAAGADAIIDISRPNLRDSLRDQVFAATGNHGADIVIDPLGGDPFDAALRAVAWSGRLISIGFAAGRIPEVKANYLLVKNIEVSGLQVSDYRKRQPEKVAACYRELFDLFEQGKLKGKDATTFPLDGFAEALDGIKSRKIAGRVVLLPRNDR